MFQTKFNVYERGSVNNWFFCVVKHSFLPSFIHSFNSYALSASYVQKSELFVWEVQKLELLFQEEKKLELQALRK